MSRILVIGAGGVRSFAGVGVYRALQKVGWQPTRFVGASMGALVGAALSFQIDIQALMADVANLRVRNLIRPQWLGLGLLSNSPWFRFVSRHFPDVRIEDAPTALEVWCTDIISGESVVLREGRLRNALVASCLLAGAYEPVRWRLPGAAADVLLVDGGYRSTVPNCSVEPSDDVIAVDARCGVESDAVVREAGRHSLVSFRRWRSMLSMFEQGLNITYLSQSVLPAATNTRILRPSLPTIRIHDFDRVQSVVASGVLAANSLWTPPE